MNRATGMLVHILLICSLVVSSQGGKTFAANIRLITTNSINSSIADYNNGACNLLIEGEIYDGDLKRIQNEFQSIKQEGDSLGLVCLNSPGGSYFEGLRIAKFLLASGVGTIIQPAHSCFSACAIIFMAGTEINEGFKLPSRRLHARGTLGFHAPYAQTPAGIFDERAINAMFKAGISALAELIALEPGSPHSEFFHKELIVEMSRRGPTEEFLIDTVRKAIKFDINIYGLSEPRQITKGMVCTACGNVNPISQFSGCLSEDEIKSTSTEFGMEFSVPVAGAEDNRETCKVFVTGIDSVHGRADGPIQLTYNLGSRDGSFGVWHLYPADTPIKSLPMR